MGRRLLAAVLASVVLGGCAVAPRTDPPYSDDPVVRLAQEQVGRPYLYGGETPAGFDCSGLVYYAHREALGIDLPRTAGEQYRQASPVSTAALGVGDLVFFRPGAKKDLHVGIYVDDGVFLHAPSSGRRVSYARLADRYWRGHLLGAGSFRDRRSVAMAPLDLPY
jgi:cell wall-associated NlpC family hydrolase